MRTLNFFKRKSKGEAILHLFVSFIFLLVALSYIYILVWALFAGLKTHTEVVMNPFSLPKEWHWEHFLEVFQVLEVNQNNFFDMFINSVWFSVVGVLIQQFVSINLAYACSKYTFPGSKYMYTLVLIVITLPIYGNSGAMYKLIKNLGLLNSYAQIVTCASAITMYFLYYMAFFKNLSWTYAEAAMMDGANDFQIYFKVMFPQAKPIFGALFLSQWIVQWNSYESALVYLPKLPLLPVGIYQFSTEMQFRARLDILFAACVIVALPAILLFIIFNKTITSNVSAGGIKG